MKCSFCGNENDDTALFCTMCGKTLTKETEADNPVTLQQSAFVQQEASQMYDRQNSSPYSQQTTSPYYQTESPYYQGSSPYAQQSSQQASSPYAQQFSQQVSSPYAQQQVSSPYAQQPSQQVSSPYAQQTSSPYVQESMYMQQPVNNQQTGYNQAVYGQNPQFGPFGGFQGAGAYGSAPGVYYGSVVSSNSQGGIAVMVLGIVSLALSVTWIYWITSTAGLIVGIIGLVKAHTYKVKTGSLEGKARVGKGLSLAGTILGGIWTLIIVIVVIAALADM